MNNELYHHGVKGMRWGFRKAERKASRRDVKLNRTINAIEKTKQRNQKIYDTAVKGAEKRYGKNPKQSTVLKNKKARLKTYKDISDTRNNFEIARRKAKLDPAYKKSESYKKAKKAYSKQALERFIYGEEGQLQLQTLRNKGLSEKQARGKTIATNIIRNLFNKDEIE